MLNLINNFGSNKLRVFAKELNVVIVNVVTKYRIFSLFREFTSVLSCTLLLVFSGLEWHISVTQSQNIHDSRGLQASYHLCTLLSNPYIYRPTYGLSAQLPHTSHSHSYSLKRLYKHGHAMAIKYVLYDVIELG